MSKKPTGSDKRPTRALARVGDPYVAPNGEKISPEGGTSLKKGQEGVSATSINPLTFRPMKKRNLKDLPGAPNVINAVSTVFMYTILGVGDREIADTLGTSVDQINLLRTHTAYSECFLAVLGEFINTNSDLLSARIAAYSQTALDMVGTLATTAKKDETRLSASKDILDRAGVKAKDTDARQAALKNNELRIIIIEGEADITVSPHISIE